MAFVKRKIRVTFTLTGTATFDEGGNKIVIEDKMTSVRITKAGAPFMGSANIQIWGLTLSVMNQLATLGVKMQLVPKANIVIEAGSDQPGDMAKVFHGGLIDCWGDFDASPDVPMNVEASGVLPQAVIGIKPSEFTGSTDVATVIEGLAKKMGFGFENNGVTAKIAAPYLDGSAWDQAAAIAQHSGTRIVQDLGVIVIWPKNGTRRGEPVTVSPANAMIGYPTFTNAGVIVRTEFNRNILMGGQIKLEGSILTAANGTYYVSGVDQQLDAEVPNGKWESVVQASRLNPSGGPAVPVLK